jgi:nucleoid-associated protein YgaU
MGSTPNNASGEVTKLKFTAYKDSKFEEKIGKEPYTVMINPESFKRGLGISYKQEQSKGSTALEGKFDKMNPETYSFDFVIDGTGVATGKKESVRNNIEDLLSVVYKYNSGSHRPPYVRIEYCGLIIKCILKSLDISYTLFDPDSTPLRAKISCSFSSVENPVIEAKITDKQSPDITHRRIMQEGETLMAMANGIYNSDLYYMDVAEKNNLNNFRRIKPGTAIYFPPLKN